MRLGNDRHTILDLVMKGERRWRKVLYVQQPYPDNYVDPDQFLDGLRKNRKLR